MSLSRRVSSTVLIGLAAVSSPVRSQSLEMLQTLLQQGQGAVAGTPLGVPESKKQPVTSPRPVTEAPKGAAAGFEFEPGLRPFGERLFSVSNPGYLPPSDMPVPADYVVGTGDVVELRLFGKENRLYRLPVERNGTVTLPDIGAVTVVGRTFENMSQLLLDRLAKQKIGVEATISMGPMRSIQVLLTGDVNSPGAYTVDALTTVVNAMLIGGGIKPSGSMRHVEVRRQGRVVANVDLYAVLLNGADGGGLRLQSGDTIFVPRVGRRASISGAVLRPAIYELAGEKTAEDLLRLAGGLLPNANPAWARLDRVGRVGSEWQRQGVDVALTSSAAQRSLVLQNGDGISIPAVRDVQSPAPRDLRHRTVTLAGQVERPGPYEWREGMHLGELLGRAGQLNLDAYRLLAIVEHVDEASGSRTLRTANLLKVMRGQKTEPLARDDRVIVLSHTEVNYLSSADVQLVLAGRMPTRAGSTPPGRGTLLSLKATGSDEERLKKAVEANDLDARPAAEDDRGAPAVEASVAPSCEGLVELSTIVADEGVARFRSALFSYTNQDDGSHLVKSQVCPSVFSQSPALLPFLLENAITLRGEVQNPGVLPVPAEVSLATVLSARGGVSREADPSGIEISQLVSTPEGKALVQRSVIERNADLGATPIKPGDIVQVRRRASNQENGLIRLRGEFVHPGNYEIRKGEKLSELIARAGGLSEYAYPLGTVFQRPAIREEKKQYYAKIADDMESGLIHTMSRQYVGGGQLNAGNNAAAVMTLIGRLRNVTPVGRMVVESDPTVLEVRPELDVALEVGDEIYVPRRPSTITVVGEVLNPGAVQFEPGKQVLDYVRDAGGTTRMADEDRAYAILPNGSSKPIKISSWNLQRALLPPGSVVFIPREMVPVTSIDMLTLSLQVLKDLALSAASLSVISK